MLTLEEVRRVPSLCHSVLSVDQVFFHRGHRNALKERMLFKRERNGATDGTLMKRGWELQVVSVFVPCASVANICSYRTDHLTFDRKA